MSEFKRTNRDDCKYYDNDSGCEFNNKKRWCMPWGACVYFEDKNAAQEIKESTAHLTTPPAQNAQSSASGVAQPVSQRLLIAKRQYNIATATV